MNRILHNIGTPNITDVTSELSKKPIWRVRLLGNRRWTISSSSIVPSRSLFQFPTYTSMSGVLNICLLILAWNFLFFPATSYSLPEKYTHRITELVEKNRNQLSVKEYSLIAETLLQKRPCNMLIFGVGNDSSLWIDLNIGGTTLFLESNAYWLNHVQSQLPDINVHLVHYNTLLSDWKYLLNNKNRRLLKLTVPEVVLDTQWDIIFVDGPEGYNDSTPGRMKSIYTTSLLANQQNNDVHIFVHDCDRNVEAVYTDKFLQERNLKQRIDRLNYYIINSRRFIR